MSRRAKLTQGAVDDLFAATEPRPRNTPYDQKYQPHTYRVADVVHSKIKAIAAENDVRLNDLVRWIFKQFIEGYKAGEIVLPVEEYVVTRSRLT